MRFGCVLVGRIPWQEIAFIIRVARLEWMSKTHFRIALSNRTALSLFAFIESSPKVQASMEDRNRDSSMFRRGRQRIRNRHRPRQ